jgi:hypothetical protein
MPPAFGNIVDAAMGLAGELNLFKRDGDAAKITAAATRLGVAIAGKDPQAITTAALGLRRCTTRNTSPPAPNMSRSSGR